jgi:hypothetical protein
MDEENKERKPISIAFGENSKEIGIVCNDGSMWRMQYVIKPGVGGLYEWARLPDVPQGDISCLRLK